MHEAPPVRPAWLRPREQRLTATNPSLGRRSLEGGSVEDQLGDRDQTPIKCYSLRGGNHANLRTAVEAPPDEMTARDRRDIIHDDRRYPGKEPLRRGSICIPADFMEVRSDEPYALVHASHDGVEITCRPCVEIGSDLAMARWSRQCRCRRGKRSRDHCQADEHASPCEMAHGRHFAAPFAERSMGVMQPSRSAEVVVRRSSMPKICFHSDCAPLFDSPTSNQRSSLMAIL